MDAARIVHAGGVLARAFDAYPLFRELFPEERRRQRALLWYMGFILRYCTRYGEVYTTANDEGVLTFLTGSRQFTRRKLLAAGLQFGPLHTGIGPFLRLMKHNNHVGHVSSQLVPPDAWYAWVMGVDAPARKKGLGLGLMNRLLVAADAAGASCYCDTDRREMLGLLTFLGFKVVHEGRTPTGGLPFWVYLRPAVAKR